VGKEKKFCKILAGFEKIMLRKMRQGMSLKQVRENSSIEYSHTHTNKN